MFRSIATTAALLISVAAGLTILNQSASSTQAHCQVPCGIFDDDARIQALYEDAATIERSMQQMNELASNDDAQSRQQFIRWTMTKEEHASRIITVVSEYFLTQKLKPVAQGDEGYDAYLAQLALHHNVLIAAMKAKQTTDVAAVTTLRNAIHEIEHLWGTPHEHEHDHGHEHGH